MAYISVIHSVRKGREIMLTKSSGNSPAAARIKSGVLVNQMDHRSPWQSSNLNAHNNKLQITCHIFIVLSLNGTLWWRTEEKKNWQNSESCLKIGVKPFLFIFFCYWLSSVVIIINHESLINLYHLWLLLTPGICSIAVKLIKVKVSGGLWRRQWSEFIDDLTVFAQSFHHIHFFSTAVTLCRNQILVSILQRKHSWNHRLASKKDCIIFI